MKKYISQNKATVFSLGFAGAFMSIIISVAFILDEISPVIIF